MRWNKCRLCFWKKLIHAFGEAITITITSIPNNIYFSALKSF
jgi:hypothetical protein